MIQEFSLLQVSSLAFSWWEPVETSYGYSADLKKYIIFAKSFVY